MRLMTKRFFREPWYCALAIWAVLWVGPVSVVQAADQAITPISQQLVDGELLNDPTRPEDWSPARKTTPKAVRRHFSLGYTVVSAQRKQAFINGKSVTEGDFVDGAKVLRISDNRVRLMVDGQVQEITRKKSSITKTVR